MTEPKPKKIRTRRSDIKVDINYGQFLNGYYYQVSIGNSLLATDIYFITKPTAKQIRQLKKAWFNEMKNPDLSAVFYKKYSIAKGRYDSLRKMYLNKNSDVFFNE